MTAERQAVFRIIVKMMECETACESNDGFAGYYLFATANQIFIFVTDTDKIFSFISQVTVLIDCKIMAEKPNFALLQFFYMIFRGITMAARMN